MRATVDHLAAAVEWIESYEAAPDEPAEWVEAVAAFLRAEIARRDDAAKIRQIAAIAGVSPERARKALRDARNKPRPAA